MAAFIDLTGRRFGDLTVLRQDSAPYISPGGKKTIRWIVRCERCGKVLPMLRSTLVEAKSCGCVRNEKSRERGARRQNYKTCPVCGKRFASPPSDETVTCSRECRSKWRTITQTGKSRPWSAKAKERYAQNEAHIAQARKQIKKAAEAALALPEGQRGSQNRECLIWELKDPSGNYHIAEGLLPWARENYLLFFPDGDVPQELAANRISSGFQQIAMTLRGTKCKKDNPSQSYKGWTLVSAPKEKIASEILFFSKST